MTPSSDDPPDNVCFPLYVFVEGAVYPIDSLSQLDAFDEPFLDSVYDARYRRVRANYTRTKQKSLIDLSVSGAETVLYSLFTLRLRCIQHCLNLANSMDKVTQETGLLFVMEMPTLIETMLRLQKAWERKNLDPHGKQDEPRRGIRWPWIERLLGGRRRNARPSPVRNVFRVDINGGQDVVSPQCCKCAHITSIFSRECKAFPDGIPLVSGAAL